MAPKLSRKRGSSSLWSRVPSSASRCSRARIVLLSSVSVQLTLVYGPVTHGMRQADDLIRRK